jgi:predicted metal-dependent hydrolase
MQKIWIGKTIVSFQTPEFLKTKQYRYFYAKKKNWIVKAIVSFQTP